MWSLSNHSWSWSPCVSSNAFHLIVVSVSPCSICLSRPYSMKPSIDLNYLDCHHRSLSFLQGLQFAISPQLHSTSRKASIRSMNGQITVWTILTLLPFQSPLCSPGTVLALTSDTRYDSGRVLACPYSDYWSVQVGQSSAWPYSRGSSSHYFGSLCHF